MNNRPYLSEAQIIINENVTNTVPAQFGNNNLLVNHEQQRKIFDSATTSIGGQQHPQMFNQNIANQQNLQNAMQIAGQRQVFPGGVTYTFCPPAQGCALRNSPDMNAYYSGNSPNMTAAYQQQQPLNLQQQIALNQLQKHALESLLLHEQFRENPFKLQFHKDGQTNTDNLYKDFCKCTSKNTLLRTLEEKNTSPTVRLDLPKPEQLYPNTVKRKQLRIKPCSNFEDKSIQFSPDQQSMDVQVDTIVSCSCKKEERPTADNQTTTKKVTFDETHTHHRRPRHKNRPMRKSRQVDEDSSDSSYEGSSSSKSSEEKS